MLVDGGWDTAPQARVGNASLRQNLRHLRNMPEHVGQVADAHGATERLCTMPSHFQITDDGLTRAEKLIEQDLPGPDRQMARDDQCAHPLGVLWPDFEVVLDRRRLSVEREPEIPVFLCTLDNLVEHPGESEPENLEGFVPLAVPVRVRNQHDAVF